jgi:type II secretory pathway pseudopilin PulG
MMKARLFKQSGQALVIIAIAAVGLFGIVGLAVDGSAKFSDRRHAQNAADTAALAAALTKANGLAAVPPEIDSICKTPVEPTTSDFCLDIIYAAWDRAVENGYDGLLPDSVDVYSPPISGPYINNASYVQVIITSYTNTYFARVLGIRQTKNTVEAVALADEGGPLFGGASLISVNPSPGCPTNAGVPGGGSVDIGGNGTVNLDGGGIFVNSDETCGYVQTSCGLTLNITNGGKILTAGSPVYMKDKTTGSDCNTSNAPAKDTTQKQYVVPDDIYMPDEPAECKQTAYAQDLGGNKWRITPGYYTIFPHQEINGGHGGKKVDIVMDHGVYCVDGDVDWNGNIFNSLDGTSGVTIYIKSGNSFSFRINSTIKLHADGSPEYDNFLIIVNGSPSNIESCQIDGGNYLSMNGMIYAPYCDVTINGDSTSNSEFHAQVLGWNLKVNGGSTINFKYHPDYVPVLKRKVGLMR